MTPQDHLIEPSPVAGVPVFPPGKISEQQFAASCDEDTRAEWVDGEVLMMSPANLEHCDLEAWLLSLLRMLVEQHDLGIVLSEAQVRLSKQRSLRVPDIWFLSNQRRALLRATHLDGPPDLIVEIVSPDSEARDWREKYIEYQAAGVREYWVIDPMSQHVEAYALPEGSPGEEPAPGSQYVRLEERDGFITSAVLPMLRLRTAWLWPETRPKVLDSLRELSAPGMSRGG
jgi:Uma2 family endonuclease